MPLCYHPSIEYQLDAVRTNKSSHTVDVVFPGIVKGKPRREAIVKELNDAGISVKVRRAVLAPVGVPLGVGGTGGLVHLLPGRGEELASPATRQSCTSLLPCLLLRTAALALLVTQYNAATAGCGMVHPVARLGQCPPVRPSRPTPRVLCSRGVCGCVSSVPIQPSLH